MKMFLLGVTFLLVFAWAILGKNVVCGTDTRPYEMICRNCGINSHVTLVTESDTQSSLSCPVCKHTFYFSSLEP